MPVNSSSDDGDEDILCLAFLNHTEWQTLDEREVMEKNKKCHCIYGGSLEEKTHYKETNENELSAT